jgi:hypothetical protein
LLATVVDGAAFAWMVHDEDQEEKKAVADDMSG